MVQIIGNNFYDEESRILYNIVHNWLSKEKKNTLGLDGSFVNRDVVILRKSTIYSDLIVKLLSIREI